MTINISTRSHIIENIKIVLFNNEWCRLIFWKLWRSQISIIFLFLRNKTFHIILLWDPWRDFWLQKAIFGFKCFNLWRRTRSYVFSWIRINSWYFWTFSWTIKRSIWLEVVNFRLWPVRWGSRKFGTWIFNCFNRCRKLFDLLCLWFLFHCLNRGVTRLFLFTF